MTVWVRLILSYISSESACIILAKLPLHKNYSSKSKIAYFCVFTLETSDSIEEAI
jgi:hypothetical protein